MKHEINLILKDGTEIQITRENRLIFKNRYLNFDVDFGNTWFCYGDEEGIEAAFKSFMNGELTKVTITGKIEPDLTFVLMPKGAKTIRELGDSFFDDLYYDCNSMRIELDLCLKGAYGGSFFVVELNEEETEEFINQWLGIKK